MRKKRETSTHGERNVAVATEFEGDGFIEEWKEKVTKRIGL